MERTLRGKARSLISHDSGPAPAHGAAETSAIVLAGGKSSRMGRPKAWLPFDDEPVLVHVVRTLSVLFPEVVIVAAPGQELPDVSATIVRDDVAHQGPVGGITYGLRATRGGASFVTSCDAVFVNAPLIAHLRARLPGHDAVVPRWHGRLQPLCAVYRRSVLPVFERQLANGDLRTVDVFDRVRACTIGESEIRRFDPEGASFLNINTPADYEEALRRWEASARTRRDSSD